MSGFGDERILKNVLGIAICERCSGRVVEGFRFCPKHVEAVRKEMRKSGYLEPEYVPGKKRVDPFDFKGFWVK